jgi:hypothetical protein
LADLTVIMTAATFKKIAMAMAIVKIEIHMAGSPYPGV